MIVASLPRCGATRYCLDRSLDTGLPFVGEFHPTFIDSYNTFNKKVKVHETGYQPTFSKEQYIEALVQPSKFIVLHNHLPHTIINQADVVVLRKDMATAFRSTANFLIKMYPSMKANVVIEYLHMFFQSFYGSIVYLESNAKPIVWYEDYFTNPNTSYTLLDNHIHCKSIDICINMMMSHEDCKIIFEKVKENAQNI